MRACDDMLRYRSPTASPTIAVRLYPLDSSREPGHAAVPVCIWLAASLSPPLPDAYDRPASRGQNSLLLVYFSAYVFVHAFFFYLSVCLCIVSGCKKQQVRKLNTHTSAYE